MSLRAFLPALLVSGGRIAFVALWFVALMLVYGGLARQPDGLAQAGVFALAIACIKVASGFISDPIDLAVMRAVPPRLHGNPVEALDVLRAALGVRLVAVLAIAVPVAVFAPVIATLAVPIPGGAAVVRWVALAIVGDTLFRATLVVQQARERFGTFVLLEGLLQVGRTGAIALLWAFDAMRVDWVLLCYASVSLGTAAVGALLLPPGLAGSLRGLRRHVVELVDYVRWMVPAMMLAGLNERLDVFLVYSFRGSDAAGLYGAVLTLALVPDILGGCLSTVLQPRIVRMHERREIPAAFRRYLTLSLPLCAAGMGAAILLAGPLLPLMLGAKYAPAIPAFLWLLAGTLFWLAVTPLPMTLVAIVAPGRILAVTILQTVTVVASGVVLLALAGPVGMAQGIFITRVVVALTLCGMAHSVNGAASPVGRGELPGPA